MTHPTDPANGAMTMTQDDFEYIIEPFLPITEGRDWRTFLKRLRGGAGRENEYRVISDYTAALCESLTRWNELLSASAPAAPQGWKLVPIEPTNAMLDAYISTIGRFPSARSDWRAMLAAAPAAPQPSLPAKAGEAPQSDLAERAFLAARQWATSDTPVATALAYRDGYVAGAQSAAVLDDKRAAFAKATIRMLEAYAESYHCMSLMNGGDKVSRSSVAFNIRHNMIGWIKARAASPQSPKGDERGNDVDIADFLELIDDYQCAQKDGTHDERARARIALMNAYRSAVARAAAPQAGAWLTADYIRETFQALRHRVEDCDSGIDDENIEAFIAKILSHPTGKAEDAQAWHPIETAPKDGTPLILFARAKHASASAPVFGWWIPALGWIESAFSPNSPVGIIPSHWMPRPDFPTATQPDEGSR